MRPPPPGYEKLSMEQLRRTDREIFRRLMETTREGITRSAAGSLPCELALPGILVETSVQILLMPLPERPDSKRKPDSASPGDQPMSLKARKKLAASQGKGT
eukprot:11225393-Karenia_brevis.AAC.1